MEYKNIDDFIFHLKNGQGCDDVIKVDGVEYVMDSYDMEGRYIQYRDAMQNLLEVETSDRYNNGYDDVKVTLY